MPKLEIVPERLPLNEDTECTVLHVKGFADAPNYDQFYTALEKAVGESEKYLILDFSGLSYINSTGISTLIRCQGRLAQRGGVLVLAHVSRPVAASLHLLGLTTVVPLVKDVGRAQEVARGVAQGTLPAGGLSEAAEIKETARRIPVWPQKPLVSKSATVMVVVPAEGHFTDVLNLRLTKANASFMVFNSREDALKHFKKVSPDVVIVDDRVDPKGLFLAHVKMEQGHGLSSVIKLYPEGAEVKHRSGFRIWENDYLVDPFELMELFSLAETELRRVPHDREHAVQEVRYAFRSTPDRVEKACELAYKLMSQSGLDVTALDSLYAAFKEAVDNAVKHGNQHSPDKEVDVIYLLERDRVRIQITDEGEGFDYEFYLAWSVTAAALEEAKHKIVKEGKRGGLGILLMRRCTDKLEYRGAGNVVCLEKKIA
jgi:serine/threonine-protein kinase RsbW